MSETLDSFVVAFGESADAAPLGEEEKNFDAVFEPLRNKLDASMANTRGVEDLPKRVKDAETRADDIASDAESAAIGERWDEASGLLDQFKTAMGKLDEVYMRSADLLARRMDLRIAKLTLRHQELKATGLTQAAGDTEAKLTAAVEARTTANAGATPEVRLVALQKAYGDALLAHLEADDALAAKSNDGAARGLSDIRQGMADAIATLDDAIPDAEPRDASDEQEPLPTKADLQARLAGWDKRKAANDKWPVPDGKRSGFEDLHQEAAAIIADARAVAADQKKSAAVRTANAAGDKAADGVEGGDAREVARRAAMVKSIHVELLAGLAALPDGLTKKAQLQHSVDLWAGEAIGMDHAQAIADEREHTADGGDDDDVPYSIITSVINLGADYIAQMEAAAEAVKEQQVYEKALKSRFGVEIEVPPGMTNTHFEQFYKMMERVPIEHVSIDSLKKLKYDKDDKGAASYYDNSVIMGNFEDDAAMKYTDPETGKPISDPDKLDLVSSFSISSLHEIGHAVDHQYKIMSNNQTDPRCGAWQAVPVPDMLAALLNDAKAAAGTLTMDDDTVKDLLNKAMTKGKVDTADANEATVAKLDDTDKPAQVAADEWQKIKPVLDKAVSMRSDNRPWEQKADKLLLGTRAYHEAYDGEWVSYDPKARASQVRNYQFRAPGEWFADLYAWSWYTKSVPPSTVSKDVAKYLFSKRA